MTKIQEENERRELAFYQALAQGRDAASWRETAEAFRLRNLDLMDQIDALRDAISAMQAALEKYQWGAADRNESPCCPACWEWPEKGHEPDCPIGKAIASAQNVTAHEGSGSTTAHVERSTENGTA